MRGGGWDRRWKPTASLATARTWSLTVSRNWRLAFRIDPAEQVTVDLNCADYSRKSDCHVTAGTSLPPGAAFLQPRVGRTVHNTGEPQRLLTKDEMLDDITLYWLTNSATSSARLYWANGARSPTVAAAQKTAEISLPVAITVFPDEIYRAPATWARRAYRNLIYFHEVDKGGHFAAWEQPELFSAELRTALRPLR
jgi:pimeloyl-ACP methyl ester carboxylesterase